MRTRGNRIVVIKKKVSGGSGGRKRYALKLDINIFYRIKCFSFIDYRKQMIQIPLIEDIPEARLCAIPSLPIKDCYYCIVIENCC